MKSAMIDIETFKIYATSYWVPNYFRDYVKSLREGELEWFYTQVKEALEFLTTEAYLIYKFKWISQRKFSDLSKEIYLEYLYNPEMFKFDIIKPEYEDILEKRYCEDEDIKNYYSYGH